jgi:CrcB protein
MREAEYGLRVRAVLLHSQSAFRIPRSFRRDYLQFVLLWIALGGAAGTVARYGVGVATERLTATWPLGTLIVNIVGSFFLGLFTFWLRTPPFDPALRAALTIGLCGGFTTFSTFSYETLILAEQGGLARSLTYIALSVGLSVLAMLAGVTAARAIPV